MQNKTYEHKNTHFVLIQFFSCSNKTKTLQVNQQEHTCGHLKELTVYQPLATQMKVPQRIKLCRRTSYLNVTSAKT